MEFKNFNAIEVPLDGSNLIEASAGTGKTYSIAILLLRLLLDKQIPIKEILMVTFTKAAVAELEERIRLFVRQAHRVCNGEEITDNTIRKLVENAIHSKGAGPVAALLHEAVLYLDETSVLTIHSFCQQTLNEFAFETKQLFGADLIQDIDSVLTDEINKFWRSNVTTIPLELLQTLAANGLSRKGIFSAVKEHLGGKRYMGYEATKDYNFSKEHHEELIASLNELKIKEAELRRCLLVHFEENKESIRVDCLTNRYAKKSVLHLVDSADKFLQTISSNRKSNYILQLFQPLLDKIDECDAVLDERNEIGNDIIRKLYCLAINEAAAGIYAHKSLNNQMSYDDLIVNLHTALVQRVNSKLVERLQAKYKAVFIDEFQDTDRMQYDIFHTAFGSNTILFYIGDPKQSIYAWRKADIFTYFNAKAAVGNLYSMNQNFRSSANYIDAMNEFFLPTDGFDTFHYEGADTSIDYIKVDSPSNNTKGNFFSGDQIDKAISIRTFANKPDICEAAAAQVLDLLTNKTFFIKNQSGQRNINPGDIGILVRSKSEGSDIKTLLSRHGVPAVTITGSRVLQSREAKYVLYLLEAMSDISISSINKAIMTPFTGFCDEDIVRMDSEGAIELFRKYKASWEKDGIYTALNYFVTDYQVKRNLLNPDVENGERAITNLYQLIELLHKTQTSKKLSATELVSWVNRCINGMETEGDEYEQRIENDEEAVKIVTIHASKGLEYNIVLAPFLSLETESKHTNCSFRDPETGDYVSGEKTQLSPEQAAENTKQLEQENRRLIYVAITRAVYKCYIFNNSRKSKSSLSFFITALHTAPSQNIEFNGHGPDVQGLRYINTAPVIPDQANHKVQFKMLQRNWRKISYSFLSSEHKTSFKSNSNTHQDEYENFIFSSLKKGVKTGNMLHYIFENISFSDQSRWQYTINNAIGRFSPDQADIYSPMLKKMLNHIFNTVVRFGADSFQLSQLDMKSCINEFEFDFSVSPFTVAKLKTFGDETDHIDVSDWKELEGVMNGKIDLFFEHNGKYYILDWKSNYLGDSLKDYSVDSLALAMNENNYHLQYLIYTLAIKKYLEIRLPGFDYETQFGGVIYLFVRGVRDYSNEGVFLRKPTLQSIDALAELLSQNERSC